MPSTPGHGLVARATSNMHPGDTIVAISSAVGQAARMIVRLSGPEARRIGASIATRIATEGGSATRCELRFCGLRVGAWVYVFTSPHSYTGEDVVEFHIPGNPLLARMLLDELIARGARHAEAGEFTARAYFNGRMDLSEAEGVAATIAAHSERELHAARQLLAGELARRLRPILDSLADSLALLEVGIDFSEEDVTFLTQADLRDRIGRADQSLEQLLAESARFESLSHEPRIVLVGRPNAGKSTLLNALAGEDRAIVSAQAGTTRDAIWSQARLGRGMVRIIDVAGLDDTPNDEVSTRMQRAARSAMQQADVVVLVKDITDAVPVVQVSVPVDLTVLTKIDLLAGPLPTPLPQAGEGVAVSALSGANMDSLRERLDQLAFGQPAGGATLALNARHVESIEQARLALQRAADELNRGAEVVAMELREALDCLGGVVGSVSPDDVLGRIFSSFCIGK